MSVNKDISRLKILVVDDDVFAVIITVRILKGLGFDNIITADSGKSAIKHLNKAKESVDIIFCDLKMPEMDGFEFMQYLAENDYACGLILQSGKGDYLLEAAYDMARKKNVNILGAISKPMKPDILKKLLEEFVTD
jgi:CheY-like chemotaxis protein